MLSRLILSCAILSLAGCIAVPEPLQPAPVAYQAPVRKQTPRAVRPAPKPVAAKPVATKPAPVKPPAPFGGPVIPGRMMDDGGGNGGSGGGGAGGWG
jgi:hypothetical protein